MTRSFTDSRIRGQGHGYSAPSPHSVTYDPPCLVPCPHCEETVIAVHKRYFDAPAQLHAHQPHLAKESYGEFHVNPPDRKLPPE